MLSSTCLLMVALAGQPADVMEARVLELEARVEQLEAMLPVAQAAGPTVAYDSGWLFVRKGEEEVLTHGVGGDTDRYIVLFDCKNAEHGQNHIGYGGRAKDGVLGGYMGAYYYQLDSDVVTLRRASDDTFCNNLRIRIITY